MFMKLIDEYCKHYLSRGLAAFVGIFLIRQKILANLGMEVKYGELQSGCHLVTSAKMNAEYPVLFK